MWVGLGPFTFIIGTTTAFTTGCVAWGKWPPVSINAAGSFVINGGIIVYLIGAILWFTQEIGRSFFIYPLVVYGLGFAALIAANIFVPKILAGENRLLRFLALWLCAFSGLIGGATIGNFFALALIKMPKEMWAALAVITPIERAIFAAGAALVGVPLLLGLNKIGIHVGPENRE
jgi:hypothetical protein